MLSTWLYAFAYGGWARSFDTKLKPNITGKTQSIYCAQWSSEEMDDSAEGALYLDKGKQYEAAISGAVTTPRVCLDASRSSSLYSGERLQAPALSVLACIKL